MKPILEILIKKKKSMALINIEVITVRELGILIIEMSHGARDIY